MKYLASLILLAKTLHAVPVAVGDPSFEGNSLAVGGYSGNIAPEWFGTNGQNSVNQAFEEYITGFAADGTDHLGMALGYDVWQNLSVTYQANTRYTLTIAAGNRSGQTQSGNITQYSLADSNGVIYGTGNFNASTIPMGTFADAPALIFSTPNNTTSIGKTIRILIQARGSGRSHFDHIRLDASPLYPVGSATLDNRAATAVSGTSATLNGSVTNIGNNAPTITFFYGTVDGGIEAANWQNSINLPATYSGNFSQSISGLTAGGVTYYFSARATNSAGVSWASPSQTFQTLANPPAVGTGAASNVGATTATVAANVVSTGGEVPDVTIYYGTSDGGTNPASWSSNISLGAQTGATNTVISGLSPQVTYYFRAFAQNSGGSTWATTSGSFTTLAVSPASIAWRSIESVTGLTANLRGEVLTTGNDPPSVTLFFGRTDGGTNPASWSSAVSCGLQTGDFTRFINGLSPATAYFFRFRAINAGGTTWTETSGSFSTTSLVPATAVINEIHYDPADDANGPTQHEFIELHNPGDTAIDLSGWTISNAVSFTFPAGTILPPSGYRVIAENPTAFAARFGGSALGPWIGGLANSGETIDLKNATGLFQDTVSYKPGFPWPTSAKGGGPSIELINPSLDNDLGGAWRSSSQGATPAVYYTTASSTGWKYKKGQAEASSPVDQWRSTGYSDTTWINGTTPIGYGTTITCNTVLSDMQSSYNTVYARKIFSLTPGQIPNQLTLRTRADDGCIVWINGVEVFRNTNLPTGQLAFNANATAGVTTASWFTTNLTNTSAYLVGGTNVIAIHGVNRNNSTHIVDFNIDAELFKPAVAAGTNPTPNAVNSNATPLSSTPPQIRQVEHSPVNPTANLPVTITARISDLDSLGTVSLHYQLVDPGSYIRKSDASYSTNWTSLPMFDNGSSGDAVAGDSLYTCVMPAALQTHRRLVRYRITATDNLSNSITVPYADDDQPNFAYFVYDGVPSFNAAFRPGTTPNVNFPSATIASIQPYHLIANGTDVTNSQYTSSSNGIRFLGTLVYDGVVYDHIEFKNRGIGSTYQSGKNKWNLFFNRARNFEPRDNWGKKYKETWNNLILNANASPWAPINRGSAGVEEASSARMYELAGNSAFRTHYVHWRVIDGASEFTSQYDSDLWGLYLALEPTEGNFLEERNLPDGNIYAIEGNGGDQKHQGAGQPAGSDWISFRDALASSGQTEQWYRDNIDLDALYTFLALNRLNGNVDVRPGDNYRFYRRSSDNKWVIIAYDLDMQYIAAHHWGGTMDMIANGATQSIVVAGQPNAIRAIGRHENLAREYRNRCREILSLFASDASSNGGQIGQLHQEYASMLHTPGQTATWANLDAFIWNLHPRTNGTDGANSGQGNHKGNFFRATFFDSRGGNGGTVSTGSWTRTLADPDGDGFADFPARVQWFTDFATNTYPTNAPTWVRKATNTSGGGTDTSLDRQKGYGYKYLEWESLYGGFVDSKVEPSAYSPPILPKTDFPNKPTIAYTGAQGFPSNDLRFSTSAFSDPNGNHTYAAHQWRIAKISAPGIAGYVSGTEMDYELQSSWTSSELTTFNSEIQIPIVEAKPGNTYRARVRHKDSDGNWSYWSEPVQFTVATPDVTVWQQNIMITEIMYHPPAPSAAEISAGGSINKDDYEFIEIKNVSKSTTIDLTELRFTKGIDFNFASSAMTSLAPGAYAIIAKHIPSFQARYGAGKPVAGAWDILDNLSNSGEQLKLSFGAGTTIHDFIYDDVAPWPTTPDGAGPSLVLRNPYSTPDHAIASNWRPSSTNLGNPAIADSPAVIVFSGINTSYNGSAKSVTATTIPAGLPVSITYNGSATPPTNAGTYSVVATVDDPVYEGCEATTLTISPLTVQYHITGLSQTYDGSQKSITVTTIPAGVPVIVRYNGTSSFPVNAGTYSADVSSDSINHTGTSSETMTIAKAQASLQSQGNSPTYDGNAKSVSIITNPPNLTTLIHYNGNSNLPRNAGTYRVDAVIDDPNYQGSISGDFIITKAANHIFFTAPNSHAFDAGPLLLAATSSSGLAVTLTKKSGSATLDSSYIMSPTGSGSVIIQATQAGDENHFEAVPVEQTIAITTGFSASQWQSDHFTPEELGNPAISGPHSDPDHDGLENLIEFAMNLDPKERDKNRNLCEWQTTTIDAESYPSMTIRRRMDYPDLSIKVQHSLDLPNWTNLTETVGIPVNNGDGTETVKFRSLIPLTGSPRQFLRCRVYQENN
ncbi:MAG: hypothetical protein RLZZ553_206 [Verrucomicrobiota bacterium]|jgi:hypothetical protein